MKSWHWLAVAGLVLLATLVAGCSYNPACQYYCQAAPSPTIGGP